MDNIFTSLKNSAHGVYKQAAEKVIPVLKESQFEKKGVVTPDEFVLSGDYLVSKCKTWNWESAEKNAWEFLPKPKQYLVTRSVPCSKRCKEIEVGITEIQVEQTKDDEEGWCTTITEGQSLKKETEEIPTLDLSEKIKKEEETIKKEIEEELIPDLDAFGIDEEEDDGVLHEEDGFVITEDMKNTKVLKTRTYDISLTYDKYYQVPHVWLRGYDEYQNPLTSKQIMEDISNDHMNKTATVEAHPHTGRQAVSIHPCKHSEVMKKICDRMKEAKTTEEIKVDSYMVLFLKFLSAVIPTIEYDFTMEVKTGGLKK